MTKQLVVTIAHPIGSGIETRTFDQSPVSIGSAPANALRFDHPSVPAHQGLLRFTPRSVTYVAHAASNAAVDGVEVEPGTLVPLEEQTLVQVGPFRFCAELATVGAPVGSQEVGRWSTEGRTVPFQDSVAGIVRAAVSNFHGSAENADTLTSLVRRAVRLADEVSAAIIELRGRQNRVGLRPFETELLRRSWDKYEIADYLLDPGAPDTTLADLRRYLIELARTQLLTFCAGEGRA